MWWLLRCASLTGGEADGNKDSPLHITVSTFLGRKILVEREDGSLNIERSRAKFDKLKAVVLKDFETSLEKSEIGSKLWNDYFESTFNELSQR